MQRTDRPPYTFSPALAAAIGPEEAILAGRLLNLLEDETDRRVVWLEDRHWVVATYRNLRDDDFPFWPLETVRGAMQNLVRLGILISAQKPRPYQPGMRYWHHTLDEATLAEYASGELRAYRREDHRSPGPAAERYRPAYGGRPQTWGGEPRPYSYRQQPYAAPPAYPELDEDYPETP